MREPDVVSSAINCLEDYKHWNLISHEKAKEIKRAIRKAETNQEITNIMTRLRYEIDWNPRRQVI